MDPRHLFFDRRLSQCCAYCGGKPSTRDHVPSKVLLDKPYPPQLPVVKACEKCNQGFSLDEEYLACLLDCVISDSADHQRVGRKKVQRLLRKKPALSQIISEARRVLDDGMAYWEPHAERVKNVLLKLAIGHATYENAEFYGVTPDISPEVGFAPLPTLSPAQQRDFETPPPLEVLPEIGTRAFNRLVVLGPDTLVVDSWNVVQSGRYRYMTSFGTDVVVRVVLSEYLLGEVIWT